MKEELIKKLDEYRPLYEIGINTNDMLYAILEVIDEKADEAYEDGFYEGWNSKAEVNMYGG